ETALEATRRRPVLHDRLRRPLAERTRVPLRRTEQPVRRLRVERGRGERIEADGQRGHEGARAGQTIERRLRDVVGGAGLALVGAVVTEPTVADRADGG